MVVDIGVRIWRAARRIWRSVGVRMTPRYRLEPHLQTLSAWRAWLGFASVSLALAGITYRSQEMSAVQLALQSALQGFLLKAVVTVPAVLIAVLVVVLLPASGHHPARRVRPAFTALGIAALTLVPLVLPAALTKADQVDLPNWLGVTLGVSFFCLAMLLPVFVVACASAFVHGVRHFFCVADVHPLLPSVLAAVIGVFGGVENALQLGDGGHVVLGVMAVGGSVTTVALAGYEHHRLRRRSARP